MKTVELVLDWWFVGAVLGGVLLVEEEKVGLRLNGLDRVGDGLLLRGRACTDEQLLVLVLLPLEEKMLGHGGVVVASRASDGLARGR